MPRHPFYNSATWKRIRAAKLATNPICEYCLCMAASEVDHIMAINEGGSPTDWNNLRSACHHCHSKKTYYIEVLKRDRVPVKGCDIHGRPLDPEHWWNGKASTQGQRENARPEPFKRKTFAVSEVKDRAAATEES